MDSRVSTYEHIQTVQRIMGQLISDLQRRQQVHDQSKLKSPEVEIFDEFTPKLKDSTYGSDGYNSFLVAMKPALDHHYAANSHHPEHFREWRCPLCNLGVSNRDYLSMPQGPNESGKRYCPRCCRGGLIFESELVLVETGIRGMSLLDLVEMLADWKAATLRHNDGDICKSLELNQQRFGYSDELKQILLNTLPVLERSSGSE